jgi:hypothetical protein
MKPQAYEALQKAKALFRHPAEVDDIPEFVTQAVEPIRKPRVVLLPPNAPKFDAKTIEEEHKKMDKQKQDLAQAVAKQKQATTIQPSKLIDKYVEMSTAEACADCIKKGITKPAEIAKLTGKNINQVYTALWHLRKGNSKKFKSLKKKMPPAYASIAKPERAAQVKAKDNEWDREPTAFEDAHMVVLKSRAEYETEIAKLVEENLELKAVIKYLERKIGNV